MTDIKGYNLYRTISGEKPILLVRLTPGNDEYLDKTAEKGSIFTYEFTTVRA